jgi:tetratricopeptide (TPR) repeat protein
MLAYAAFERNGQPESRRFAESEKLYRETLELTRRALGPEHPQTVGTLEGLALDLAHENRYGEAEPLFREAVRIASEQKSVTSVGEAWYDFACGEAIAGHRDVALQYLRKAVELRWFETADMANDDDLKNLRGDPRFEALVAHAKVLTTTK